MRSLRGFSLLELIVSIIVLGIVASSIAIFLDTLKTTSKVGIREEAFFAEFSLMTLIKQKYFDENNSVDDNFYKVLQTPDGDSELKVDRIGKVEIDNNEYRSGTTDYTVSSIGADSGENSSEDYDDVDDFDGYEENISGITSQGYTLKVKVVYLDDESNYSKENISFDYNFSGVNKLTNIKLIKISTSIEGKPIVLTYPITNIGASKILSLEEIRR